MTNQRPRLSPIAWTLLEIAWKRGQPELSHNTALRLSLDMLQTLMRACQQDRSLLTNLTGEMELPQSFLSFSAAISNVIDLKLQQSRATTDFDHSVFLAIGQVLANVVWPPNEKRNLREPNLEQVVRSLARSTVGDLQVDFLQQYLANVLQHLWDGARIRLEVPDLAADTEQRLRTGDCRLVAQFAITRARERAGEESLSTADIQAGFATAIQDILEEEPQ